MEQSGDYVHPVGLSATLLNYQDVATFLRVDELKGLFYFDASYRPCGLQQQFISVTEKKAIKQFQVTNEVCYEKLLDQAGKNQTLVFAHSRKETVKSACLFILVPYKRKLLERVPIPIKESIDEPAAKINVLLQVYISQLKLDGFALVADIVFSAAICRTAYYMPYLKFVSNEDGPCQPGHVLPCARWWGSLTPLRQFKGVPQEVIRKAEGKQFPWYRYFNLNPPELGELISIPNAGRLVHRLIHNFPKLHSLLCIDLSIIPDFCWEEKIHGGAETFFILIEDVDGEIVLFHDTFVLRQRYAEDEHNDRWLHAEMRLPISFKHLILHKKFPPPTSLLELQPLPLSMLHNKKFEAIYSNTIQTFNKIQMQVFQALYTSDENVFVNAPIGSGKTICAEFALLKLWNKKDHSRVVCVEPYQEMVDQRVAEWRRKFSGVQGGKEIMSLTGETSADLRLLEKGDVIVVHQAKPAYLAIVEYAPMRPVIVFVSSRRQCRLTIDDLLLHCTAEDNPDRFLNIDNVDLQPHLDHISDNGLIECLKHSIRYYHEALSKQDKVIVERLFESGAIQVLVASKDTAWSLPVASYMVIIMGMQFFEGKEHRYVDYPVMDVLQMMGRACHPREDERSQCVLMCQQTCKDFYKKFLSEGLPIGESHLPTHLLHDYFLAEIAVKTIANKQDPMVSAKFAIVL
ncbi:P-loop containing nucleoside triphosphate hydrolase protein [Lanmaoa asiatica]|nr:P-loop containing nucleoside triphosphate hydrolase protein [Lanmaoa asiatica]